MPVGGSPAIADALARAVTKNGGEILTRAHVDELLFEGKRCVGARLADGSKRKATTGVVSNAPVWATNKLIPPAVLARANGVAGSCARPRGEMKRLLRGYSVETRRDDAAAATWIFRGDASPRPRRRHPLGLDATAPKTPSFLHLHCAFDASGLPDDLAMHHIVVRDWTDITARDNCVFVAIPSTLDETAAPDGYHVLHAYTPATEPYEAWTGLDRAAYEELKEARGEVVSCVDVEWAAATPWLRHPRGRESIRTGFV